jgi:O-antigen ligase
MSAIRLGICALVAFAVLAHGAVEAWSEAVLEIGAAALLLLWGLLGVFQKRVEVRWNPLLWPLLGLAGFGLVQYLARLSVYPYLTKIELLRLATYLMLFFLAGQAFRTAEQWRALVWFLLVLGFVVAVFGIIQHYTFNGKLYWVRELRYGGEPFGPYVNRNHFAGLMELIVPLGLGMLVLRGARRDQLPLVALFTILPIGALFLTASRGGIMTFLVQLGLLGILALARTVWRRQLAVITGVLILAGAFVAWLGVGRALERFAEFRSQEVSEARRQVMIKDSWRIFLDHPLMGTGLGTLESVYPRYESSYDGKVVNHTHNDYVEALAETGVIGGLCCLAFLVGLFYLVRTNLDSEQGPFIRAVHVGALVACVGLLVHSLVDFNLHIPSNALLFLLQASLASSSMPPAGIAD